MEPFLGEIRAFAFSRVPNGWLPCDGRQLQIQPNVALFALLGIRYGGDGKTTFNLPDLRGRTPVCYGPGMAMGLKEGTETVTLTSAQVPPHTHAVLATLPAGTNAYAAPGTTTFNTAAVSISGASAPHQNMQPSLAVNWCIATSNALRTDGSRLRSASAMTSAGTRNDGGRTPSKRSPAASTASAPPWRTSAMPVCIACRPSRQRRRSSGRTCANGKLAPVSA